jgi:hypothetical protein
MFAESPKETIREPYVKNIIIKIRQSVAAKLARHELPKPQLK